MSKRFARALGVVRRAFARSSVVEIYYGLYDLSEIAGEDGVTCLTEIDAMRCALDPALAALAEVERLFFDRFGEAERPRGGDFDDCYWED
jgi:hypothetical protein